MADTPENRYSSRGHALLTLEVATAAGLTRVQMVDLAGSEKEPAGGLHASIGSGSNSSGGGNIGSSSGDGDDTNKTAALSARLREMAQVSSIITVHMSSAVTFYVYCLWCSCCDSACPLQVDCTSSCDTLIVR
jgi:hypothetical protein